MGKCPISGRRRTIFQSCRTASTPSTREGYYDLRWFQQISNQNAFFVTRIKNNAQIEILGQHHPPNVKKGILSDEIIWFTGVQSAKKFPGELRLVEFFDEETGKTYQFITNNFNLAASTIAGIYKRRWQI